MTGRASLDWARIDDDDDAAADPAGARTAESARRDWDGLDASLRGALTQLWSSPTVRNDPECRAIFEALLVERGGEALDRAATRLGQRVDALMAERVTPPPSPALPPPRPPSLLRSLFKL